MARSGRRHRPHHGRLFRLDHAALERPDLLADAGARHQPVAACDSLTSAQPPVRASSSTTTIGRGLPRLGEGVAGFSREDLVHGGDGPLSRPTPPTTPTSCCRRHAARALRRAQGLRTSPPGEQSGDRAGAIAAQFRGVPAARARMGFRRAGFPRLGRGHLCDRARFEEPAHAGIDWRALKKRAGQKLAVRSASRPSPQAAFRRLPASASSTANRWRSRASIRCLLQSAAEAADGVSRAPLSRSPSSRRRRATSSTPRLPTSRAFASSSASRISTCTRRCRAARHPRRRSGRVFQRSRRVCAARPDQRQAAPRAWWSPFRVGKKYSARRRNANDVTSQRTDRSWRRRDRSVST